MLYVIAYLFMGIVLASIFYYKDGSRETISVIVILWPFMILIYVLYKILQEVPIWIVDQGIPALVVWLRNVQARGTRRTKDKQ